VSASGLYEIRIKRSARKEMDSLESDTHARISKAVLELESDPRPSRCTKLSVGNGYRIRVGKYRVIYTVDDSARVVEIVGVRLRDKAYA
jgi:mRNA interferase RelE/StbE